MAPFVLLVGTMTGNAEFTAEEMIQVLKDELGREAELRLMDGLGADAFQPGAIYIICTSTYGEGEVPENAKAFYAALCEQRPDLSAIRYAVFGLGDSTYTDTFNFGGKRFDDILGELGARRIGERGKHDIRSEVLPWDYGRDWLLAWYESQRGGLD
jgi:MioC protein